MIYKDRMRDKTVKALAQQVVPENMIYANEATSISDSLGDQLHRSPIIKNIPDWKRDVRFGTVNTQIPINPCVI